MQSILFNTDSYKVSMWKQYPEGTEYVYSYITARGGIYDDVVLFGIAPAIREILRPITAQDIEAADTLWNIHGEPFNYEGWKYILDTYNGMLPITIRALPEGTVVPTGTVMLSVMNTDPKVPWLTTWVETALLRKIWYMSSVATLSFQIKRTIKKYLELTGDVSGLEFKLHDFGARGATSLETASSGAAAHLLNFKGTDTFSGILFAHEFYGASMSATGFSIPAAEHSTITSWGLLCERDAYANMVKQFAGKDKIYAVVSDSYDIYKACEMWASEPLKSQVLNSGGTLVIRPDSGDPVEVLSCCMNIIGSSYGITANAKGYDVLNNVRFIWGDGIDHATIKEILRCLTQDGWSADNLAFGMGGALLNGMRRDDLGWAMKASAVCIKGSWKGISKSPINSPEKISLSGIVVPDQNASGIWHNRVADWKEDKMVTYVLEGEIEKFYSFESIRARVEKAL